MRASDLIFDCVDLLYYRCHEINPNSGGRYKYSPAWGKSKNGTIKKKINKCFQYTVTVTLIRKDLKIATEIKFYIDKYKWEEITRIKKDNSKNF